MTSHPPRPPQDPPNDPDLHADADQDEADAEAVQPGVDPDWPQTPQGSTSSADGAASGGTAEGS
jgi:hypothetical protein